MESNRYTPLPTGFERINKEPLDKYSVFNSISELQKYVASGPAYAGQICTVSFSDGKLMEYRLKNSSGSVVIQPIYKINEHIMSKSKYSTYGFTEELETVTNTADNHDNWLLMYNYNPEYNRIFSARDGYESLPEAYSILHNLELYKRSGGYDLMLVINGKIKYRWKQQYNFMLSSSSVEKGACIKYSPDDSKFICTLVNDATLTNYGIFPKVTGTDYISLYVGI